MQSVEFPRRDLPTSRLSRGSLGEPRVSDFYDIDEVTGTTGRPSDFFPADYLQTIQAGAAAEDQTLQRYVLAESVVNGSILSTDVLQH